MSKKVLVFVVVCFIGLLTQIPRFIPSQIPLPVVDAYQITTLKDEKIKKEVNEILKSSNIGSKHNFHVKASLSPFVNLAMAVWIDYPPAPSMPAHRYKMILINEEVFNQCSYGCRRFILAHEIGHMIDFNSAWSLSSFIKQNNDRRRFYEERADEHAVWLVKCYDCINEFGSFCYKQGWYHGDHHVPQSLEQGTHPSMGRRSKYICNAAKKYKNSFCKYHTAKRKKYGKFYGLRKLATTIFCL